MLALGIDLGGTAIKTAVVDVTGDVVGTGEEKTPAKQGVDACVEAMMAAADEALGNAGIRKEHLKGAGIGVPGVVLPRQGLVVEVTNLEGWSNIPLRDIMASRLGLRVELANDANAALKALGSTVPAPEYGREFWQPQHDQNTDAWRQAVKICSEAILAN